MLMPPPPKARGRERIRWGVLVSAVLHVAVLLALIVVIPAPPPPPEPQEESFSVDFEGPADRLQKGEHPAQVAAPADVPLPAHDNPAPTPPKSQPTETAPPPPPPPTPPQPVESEKKPDIAPPPKPTAPSPTPARVPPPPKVKAKPTPTPPPPIKTATNQPHPTKNPTPDTHSLLATLEKFTVEQKQVKPPTHVYNPERGGAPHGGGAAQGNLTGQLSTGQRKTIGDEVRRCYSEDTAARNYATYSTVLTVTIDASGEARDVQISPADTARAAGDPAFLAFAERARRAVLDPECAKLPVPPELLGKPAQQLTFRFRP